MPNDILLTRWATRLIDAPCSPLEFYDAVRIEIIDQDLEDIAFSFVTRREQGMLSPLRTYLRVIQGRLFFDICAILFGNSIVVSYWLHQKAPNSFDLLTELPVLGYLLKRTLLPSTYYAVDHNEHFQRCVHQSILSVIDSLQDENLLTSLPDDPGEALWDGVI